MGKGRQGMRVLRDLHADRSGSVLIWVSLLLFAVFGLVALAIDGSRYLYLNTNMKAVADAAALAAAKELNGAKDAITRARNAALVPATSGFVANTPHPAWAFGTAPAVEIDSVSVCSALGPVGSDCVVTTDPKQAAYVRVVTKSRGFTASFIGALGSSTAANSKAEATAVTTYSVCGTLQSFMCNPWEDAVAPGAGKNWASNMPVGTMVRLLEGTGAASGNWGLLDPGTQGGSNTTLPPFWAANAPSACVKADAADLFLEVTTGNQAKFAEPGMNVRFDSPIGTGDLSLSAPIVIDGLKPVTTTGGGNGNGNNNGNNNGNGNGNQTCANTGSATPDNGGRTFRQPTSATDTAYANYCNNVPSSVGSCPLPRDRSFTSITRAGATGNSWKTIIKGNGVNSSDLDAYWKNQYSGVRPTELDTRWKIYEHEVEKNPTWLTGSAEPRTPQCTGATVSSDKMRRVINVAIVDCDYWSINGASNDVPMTTLIAKFFMTEPAVRSPVQDQGTIFGELIGTFEVNDSGGVIYQNVVLVR